MQENGSARSRWAVSRVEGFVYAAVLLYSAVAIPFWPQITIWNSGVVELTLGWMPRPDLRADIVIPLAITPALIAMFVYVLRHSEFERFLRTETAGESAWFAADNAGEAPRRTDDDGQSVQ